MHDLPVTPDMVPVIKLARNLGYPYSALTGYYLAGFQSSSTPDSSMLRRSITPTMSGRNDPTRIPEGVSLPLAIQGYECKGADIHILD